MKIHQPTELIEDANVALQILKEGNERFLKGELIHKVTNNSDREVLCREQKPFAVILTCSDSRVAPEIFFDQKLGDIFIIRNAGNIADKTALGSIEFAIEYLKCKLIVVCGHTRCGAITAACSGAEFTPNIKHIIEYLKPAVEKGGYLDEIICSNVQIMTEQIKTDIIVRHQGARVVGAYFDLHSGEVKWL
ncbi:MAG: hypothetical protein FWB86_00500 [Treponema sp.]|nr:hypothetical protein [Treponema sp.]MCL2252188.1 hypothetical protein [Treponema sp.]